MKNLSIDIETFSSENLTKCGVYRYAEAPDFEVLLFGYSLLRLQLQRQPRHRLRSRQHPEGS